MPRIGMNPNREERIGRKYPPDVVACMITHLPNHNGYHAERLQIIKDALITWRAGAGGAYLVVMDNGSVQELREFITTMRPDVFIACENIGKLNAVTMLCRMFPEATISISDDDILFERDWLADQLEVLETYPPAVVTGVTTLFHATACTATLAWAKVNRVEVTEALIPEAWDMDHGTSIGHSIHAVKEHRKLRKAWQLRHGGVAAIAGSSHCQFTARAATLLPYLSTTDRYMQPLSPLDHALDDAGVLRLMTARRTAQHIGNVPKEQK